MSLREHVSLLKADLKTPVTMVRLRRNEYIHSNLGFDTQAYSIAVALKVHPQAISRAHAWPNLIFHGIDQTEVFAANDISESFGHTGNLLVK